MHTFGSTNCSPQKTTMTKLHHVKRAQKDYPSAGIKKGEPYYWWKFMYQPRRLSKTKPRRSQLTQSEYLSQAMDIMDEINALQEEGAALGTSVIEEIISQVETLREETQDKLDNMPYQLQESDAGCILYERIEACEEAELQLASAAAYAQELSEIALNDFEEEANQHYDDEWAEAESDEEKEEIKSYISEYQSDLYDNAVSDKTQEIIYELEGIDLEVS